METQVETPKILPVVVFSKATGFISSAGTTCSPELLETAENGIIIGASADVMTDYVDLQTLKIVPKGESPGPTYRFNYETKTWEDPRTIEDYKAEKWEEVKAARDAAENGGFEWNGYVFDSDPVSQSRIAGAIQLAQLDPEFVIDWTLADNSTVKLSATDMLAVGAALGHHVNVQHAKARMLREIINMPGVTPAHLATVKFT